jgi:hypothetical protein
MPQDQYNELWARGGDQAPVDRDAITADYAALRGQDPHEGPHHWGDEIRLPGESYEQYMSRVQSGAIHT